MSVLATCKLPLIFFCAKNTRHPTKSSRLNPRINTGNSNGNSNGVLLITLTCSPEGWIVKGTAQMGSAECKWKVPQPAAKRSCMIPQHSTQARCFWLGVNFGEGGKLEYLEKNPQGRSRSTETQPTYDCRGGRCKWRIQRQPNFPWHTAQGHQDGCPSGYQPCPTGLNFGDQMGTSVFPWTSHITPSCSVKIKGFFGFLSCYKMSFFMYLSKIISWLNLLLFTFIYSTQDLALWIILIAYQSRLGAHSLDLITE